MVIFFNFSPTSNHLHPLQVQNCGSNSRLVMDEDDNGKVRLERVNLSRNCLLSGKEFIHKMKKLMWVSELSAVGQWIDQIDVIYIRVGTVFCRSNKWQKEKTYISVGIVCCQQKIDHIKSTSMTVGIVFCRPEYWHDERTYIRGGIVCYRPGNWSN